MENVSLSKSKVGENENYVVSFGNDTFVSGENNGVAFYDNGVWKNDIFLTDYSVDVIDEIREKNTVTLKHKTSGEYMILENIKGGISDDVMSFDVVTSSGKKFNDISIRSNVSVESASKMGPGAWGIVVEVVLWLIDRTSSSDGGSIGECRETLAACSGAGAMNYTTETTWYGTTTSNCTVVCY